MVHWSVPYFDRCEHDLTCISFVDHFSQCTKAQEIKTISRIPGSCSLSEGALARIQEHMNRVILLNEVIVETFQILPLLSAEKLLNCNCQ